VSIFRRLIRNRNLAMQAAGARWIRMIDDRLRKFAGYLSAKSENVPKKSGQFYLFVFCLVFGGTSIYIAIRGIESPSSKIAIQNISVPVYTMAADSSKMLPSLPLLTEQQYQRIVNFKIFMDSLQSSAAGKVLYDSIVSARPGLMDSIRLVEQLYKNQTKK